METKRKRNKNIRISEFSNKQLLEMDILEIYKLLLEGRITRFPPGIWENPEAEQNSLRCAKYLLEDILNWNIEDIKSKIRMSVFIKHKLGGMMQTLYGNSPYEILSKLYPNKFMPWELHEAPTKIWHSKENRLKAMDWLINKHLKWSREDIINKYNNKVLTDNNLGGLLSEAGRGSSFRLLEEFAPGEFKPWELKSSSSGINYWESKDNRVNAIKNLIENILGWDEEQVKKYLTQDTFNNNDLSGLIACSAYNGSPYKALNEAYPNKYLPWELPAVPTGFWDIKDNRINATKWLFETKLKWSIDDIKKKVSQKVFVENGLASLIAKLDGGVYAIVLEAYPNEIQEWDFPYISATYWEIKENRIKALDYLFNERLNWNVDDIKKNISQKVLTKNNLSGLLKYHNSSPYLVIKEYLPYENIKAWELPILPNGFWAKDENYYDLIDWMIDKFNLNVNNIDMLTREFMDKYKLYSLVKSRFGSSMIKFRENLMEILKNK